MSSSSEIHRRLGHPVIDIDGHMAEYFPTLAPYLEAEGLSLDHPSLLRLAPPYGGTDRTWHDQTPAERAATRTPRGPCWSAPAAATIDLATALFPELLYERLDDMGIDFGVVYPSLGLVFLHTPDERYRRGTCRALNRANAATFAPLADRLTPVAAIPMHTPEEAVAELEFAVGELGFKAVVCAGYVQRPFAALAGHDPEVARYAFWLDQFGLDSQYDYDPVWPAGHRARGVHRLPLRLHRHDPLPVDLELRVRTTCRCWPRASRPWPSPSSSAGSPAASRTSTSPSSKGVWPGPPPSTATSSATGRSAIWAPCAATSTRPWSTASCSGDMVAKYAPDALHYRGPLTRRPVEAEDTLDEWAACAIEGAADIKELFCDRFYFGCEADDPLTSMAFNTSVNPFGAELKAMMGSDIAHWDVPDMTEVLEEAWEMVDHGWIDEAAFKKFTFTNPVRFYTGTNPGFFRGTVVEAAVDALLAGG